MGNIFLFISKIKIFPLLFIIDEIEEWIKDLLIDLNKNLLIGVEERFLEITNTTTMNISKNPSNWNGEIFNLMKNISTSVVLPIAGVVLALVMCYEIINMVIDNNNLHDFSTANIFTIIFKMMVAVLILSNSFTLIMGLFDVGEWLVTRTTGLINSTNAPSVSGWSSTFVNELKQKEISELLLITFQIFFVRFVMFVVSIVTMIIIYGRMIEIYIYISIGAIPLSTFVNKEWNMGTNYLKGLLALSIQGFFIIVTIGIYQILMKNNLTVTDLKNLFQIVIYSIICVGMIVKSKSVAMSIVNAH